MFESAIWNKVPCLEIFERYVLADDNVLPVTLAYSCFVSSKIELKVTTKCGEILLGDAQGRQMIEFDAARIVNRSFPQLIAALANVTVSQDTIRQLLSVGSSLEVGQRRQLYDVFEQQSRAELDLFLSGLSREEKLSYRSLYPIVEISGMEGEVGGDADVRAVVLTAWPSWSYVKYILGGFVLFFVLFGARARIAGRMNHRRLLFSTKDKTIGAEARDELLAYFDLAADATPDMLKKRYYSLARRLHPDAAGSSKDAFVELLNKYNQARIMLGGDSDSE
ncbi:MAG: J domain-containing protein [bacterium]|nr:J domain-containing protein [bacterium]